MRRIAGKAELREQREGILRDMRSEEHTSELQSRSDLVCRLLLEKKKKHDVARHPRQHKRDSSTVPHSPGRTPPATLSHATITRRTTIAAASQHASQRVSSPHPHY